MVANENLNWIIYPSKQAQGLGYPLFAWFFIAILLATALVACLAKPAPQGLERWTGQNELPI